MSRLDQLIRDYYSGQRLDDAAVDRILRRAGGVRDRSRYWPALVASLTVCVLAALLYWQPGARGVRELVLAEVALNHREALAPDAAAADVDELRAALPKLSFALRAPRAEALPADARLLGGRYCSVYGELAAQLKFADAGGRRYTLFVTPLTANLASVDPRRARADDVAIRLWREDDLFYALAADAPPEAPVATPR